MCVHTFINENLLQRYTFFMIYANKFKEKSLNEGDVAVYKPELAPINP